jgi:hypothetical protein
MVLAFYIEKMLILAIGINTLAALNVYWTLVQHLALKLSAFSEIPIKGTF